VENKTDLYPAAGSVGKKLKEAREKKGLTAEQVQKQTKIHTTVLNALEEGRASELLTDTYVRSFLKKYVQVLGLSAGEILKEYFPPSHEAASQSENLANTTLPEAARTRPKILYFTALAAVALVAVFIIVYAAGSIISFMGKPKALRPNTAAAAVKTAREKKAKQPKTSASIPRSSPLNVVIRARKATVVEITKDGLLISSPIFKKNSVETITAKDSIELKPNDIYALELTLNGVPVKLPAQSDKSRIVVTRKGVTLK
jgi:cytoskeletal protein RodZ